jgi:hypothetical protein
VAESHVGAFFVPLIRFLSALGGIRSVCGASRTASLETFNETETVAGLTKHRIGLFLRGSEPARVLAII